MVKCKTCSGTYELVQHDGTRYFHACPPLSGRELVDAIAAGVVQLSPAQLASVNAAKARDLLIPPAKDGESQEARAYRELAIARPNHRDENIKIAGDDKRKPIIVSDGLGEPDKVV